MSWQSTESVDEFLESAGGFLRSRPAENTMLLTIASTIKIRGVHAYGPEAPLFGWLTDGSGAFLQTPPHPLLLSAMPAGRVPELAELLVKRPLPGVNALTADAEAFTARWRELTGAGAEIGMRTRLFRLTTLVPPPPPPGFARVAEPTDRDLLIEWLEAFQAHVHGAIRENVAEVVDDKASHGGLTVWQVDDQVVSMAGITRKEAGAVRVAPVYTPPELRGRGYGAAVTAAVTQAALDAGADDVVLFTDVTNPTSNALYERLGYRPIQDRTVVEFTHMSAGKVISVNVAVPERSTAKHVGITGINKQPVDHPVQVRAPGPKVTGLHSGLVGDQIFDVQNHGGDDQAVYAYAREDLDWWQEQLGRELPGGLFGENLTTTGVDVNGALIGEKWRIGDQLVLEPTFGRLPCATFQAKMREPHWVKRFARENRPGAYLRVVSPGSVRAGDPVEVVDRPAHGITIGYAFRAWINEPELLPELLKVDHLPADLREFIERRFSRRP